jgi:hypothetical protein
MKPEPEFMNSREDLEALHCAISDANRALSECEASIRREFRVIQDALLTLASLTIAVDRNLARERKEREKG